MVAKERKVQQRTNVTTTWGKTLWKKILLHISYPESFYNKGFIEKHSPMSSGGFKDYIFLEKDQHAYGTGYFTDENSSCQRSLVDKLCNCKMFLNHHIPK